MTGVRSRREPDDDERYVAFNERRFRNGCPHCHGSGFTGPSYSSGGEPCDCEDYVTYQRAVGNEPPRSEEDDQ